MAKENDISNTSCKECNTQDTANNNACKLTKGPKVSLTVSSKKIRRENVRCTEANLESVPDGAEKKQKRNRHGTQKADTKHFFL